MRSFKFFEKPIELEYQSLGTYPDDIIVPWDRLSYDEGGAAAVRCWGDDMIAQILSPYNEGTISYECWNRGYNDTWTILENNRTNENI